MKTVAVKTKYFTSLPHAENYALKVGGVVGFTDDDDPSCNIYPFFVTTTKIIDI